MTPDTLFILVCILQAGDIYTTLRGLKLGAVESNPVVLRFMRGLGVRELPVDLAKRIYKDRYWDAVRAEELPEVIRYAMFDAAVNSGPRQAILWLQRAVGANDDGIIGPQTLAAVRAADPERLVRRVLAQRLRFMAGLPNWPAFGRGWARRIADLMEM